MKNKLLTIIAILIFLGMFFNLKNSYEIGYDNGYDKGFDKAYNITTDTINNILQKTIKNNRSIRLIILNDKDTCIYFITKKTIKK